MANHLRRHGDECTHVIDIGLDEADDIEVWRHCAGQGLIPASKDEDFVFLASRPSDTGRLIWVRMGNCRNNALIESFDRSYDNLVQAFESGQRIVELR